MKSLIIAFIILFGIAATAVYYPIQTDGTLTGDGTYESPLSVSSSFSTGKVAVTDTATMLAHFVERADTASMLSHFIERADTATMLGNYILRSGRSGGQTVVGGSGTTDDLILQSTRGVGATGAEMQFKVGNNGATRAMTILNSGYMGIGAGATSPAYPLEIYGEGLAPNYVTVNLKVPTGAATNLGTSVGLETKYLSTTVNWFFGAGSGSGNNNFRIVRVGSPNKDWLNVEPTNGYVGINTTGPDKALEVNLGTASAFRLTYNDDTGSAANYMDATISSVGSPTFNATGTSPVFTFSDPVLFDGYARLKAYTVATLPTGVTGAMAYVTDATAPTYLGALTGGGAVTCPVFYNGSAWVSH